MNHAIHEQFHSILWPAPPAPAVTLTKVEPACFHDLNLDQLVTAIDKEWHAEDLAPFFYTPAQDVRTIAYRQAVFVDLGQPALQHGLHAFVKAMRETRAHLAVCRKLDHEPEKDRAYLAAASVYVHAVEALTRNLGALQLAASGLKALHGHLADYIASAAFTTLRTEAHAHEAALDAIRYGLIFHGDSLTVRPLGNEAAACPDIEALFGKFRTAAAHDYRIKPPPRSGAGLNHIEGQVLDRVALLNPEAFAALRAFRVQRANFIDPRLAHFAREISFYLAWTAFTAPLRAAGLPLCLPAVETDSKSIAAEEAFDVVLAVRQCRQGERVVRNGFVLDHGERVIVVSGPNQGGKTTFARMFGQLHWLAALGCDVPGTRARLFLFDHLLTHFQKREDAASGRGKLQDELLRMHALLERATPRSVLVLNETFSSTMLDDALWLSRRVMARIAALDALGVCVTFLTEFADFDARTVSMVAGVDAHDPAIRTFRIERRPADGLAYALAVAEKHRVTRAWLLRRIAP